jgi:hypothetical protein
MKGQIAMTLLVLALLATSVMIYLLGKIPLIQNGVKISTRTDMLIKVNDESAGALALLSTRTPGLTPMKSIATEIIDNRNRPKNPDIQKLAERCTTSLAVRGRQTNIYGYEGMYSLELDVPLPCDDDGKPLGPRKTVSVVFENAVPEGTVFTGGDGA